MTIPNEILLTKFKKLRREFDFLAGIYTPDSWQEVQDIVRAGMGEKVFKISDQFIAEYDGSPRLATVVGINHDIPTDKQFKYSLTLQFHDCLLNCQFDAPEALYYAQEELPAGEQIFTIDTDFIKYKFTTTQPVPAGGQIGVASWGEGSYVPATMVTYAEDRRTVIETGIPVEVVESGDDTMLNLNVRTRVRYGSNNYLESNIREWLNSEDESFAWQPQTPFDRPSTAAPYTGGGFLHRLDPELVAVLGAVDKQVARNTITDGGGQDIFSDRVFLPSRVEIYGGDEGVVTGEKPYPYYAAMAASPTTAALEGRIKYLGASARYWWLRSPNTGNAHNPRIVDTDGQVSNYIANNAIGTPPLVCVI